MATPSSRKKTARAAPAAAPPRTKLEVRIDVLVGALRSKFDMPEDEAREVAELVAGLFNGGEEINDDHIDAEIRSLLYTLEAKKIMTFRREEYSWETGERRRAFYWRVHAEALADPASAAAAVTDETVYDRLPDNIWTRTDQANS